MSVNLTTEIQKRRTFAIISHPDAGKTTLTEKLLLYGGAIKTAGVVKLHKVTKAATSDFMEIEKQRGISVATSVMGFKYASRRINILDTPGHKDFAEDTYRTLTAVDSVILVIDCVKGVEEQTARLMEVCRMRNTPVIIFINKMDREGKDPFGLLDELEEKLSIHVRPLTWPVGQGQDFKGVYNLYRRELRLFQPGKTNISENIMQLKDIHDPVIGEYLPGRQVAQLQEEVPFIEELYEPLDRSLYAEGLLAPVFFGSAINNFGIRELLDTFVEIAPPPHGHRARERAVSAEEAAFSGFVFKIHANLDPNHRDRIAFMRICSGKFERNKFYYHVRGKRKLRFSNPTSFMANSKSLVEEAWPGDVVGLYDSGHFKIGDTLTEGEELHFTGIPSFSPEIFKELENNDPLKTKQLEKGIRQLTEEGVAQLFVQQPGNRRIVGTVGELQFEVIRFRLENEYGARCRFNALRYVKACWIDADDKRALDEFARLNRSDIGYDKDGNFVFFITSDWALKMARQVNPKVRFHFTSEFKLEENALTPR